jgi:hypothetical protein
VRHSESVEDARDDEIDQTTDIRRPVIEARAGDRKSVV